MPHPSRDPKTWIVLTLLGLAGSPLLAKDEWRSLSESRYTILSDANDGVTRDVATDLNDFIDGFGRMIKVDPSRLKPLTVVVFASDDDFEPFKPVLKDGRDVDTIPEERDLRTSAVIGNMYGWSIIGSVRVQNYSNLTRYAVLAGCTDWLLNGLGIRLPLAIRTGTAKAFSTFERGENHGKFGVPIPELARVLSFSKLIPVDKLLLINDLDPIILNDNRLLFDAESWALAHYLLFAHGPMERHAFGIFLGALKVGMSPHDALVKALGPDGAANIDFALSSYIKGIRYAVELPLPDRTRDSTPIVATDPADVEIALTKVMLVGHPDAALPHADAAVAAAGGRPEAYAVRAEVLDRTHAPAQQVQQAVKEALAHGSRDVWIVYEDAEFQLAEAGGRSAPPEQARAVVNLAERAANMDRNFQPSFDLVSRALSGCDHVTVDDAKFLAFARLQFPDDRWILVGESALARKKDDLKEAQRLQNLALSSDEGLSPSQLKAVRNFVSDSR